MNTIAESDVRLAKRSRSASQVSWQRLAVLVFAALDSDNSGVLSKKKLRFSACGRALLPYWDETNSVYGTARMDGHMPHWNGTNSTIETAHKDGHMNRLEWQKWMEKIWFNNFKGDDEKMRKFCAGLVWEGDIDVDDLWAVGSVTEAEVAQHFAWRSLTNRMFRTLDTDCDSCIDKYNMERADYRQDFLKNKINPPTKKCSNVNFQEGDKWLDRIYMCGTNRDGSKVHDYNAESVFKEQIDTYEVWDEGGDMLQSAPPCQSWNAHRLPWRSLVDKLFLVLDSDASGVLSSNVLRSSHLGGSLMPSFNQMNQMNGYVDRLEWNSWFGRLYQEEFGRDSYAMTSFCSKMISDTQIDMSDILTEEEKELMLLHNMYTGNLDFLVEEKHERILLHSRHQGEGGCSSHQCGADESCKVPSCLVM